MCTDEVNKNINEVKATKLPYCGDKKYFFCGGKNQHSQAKWDTCVASNAEAKCMADRESSRKSNYRGVYSGVPGPGRCGETVWMCDQRILTSEADYQASSCGIPPCRPYNEYWCNRTGSEIWCRCM